MVETWKHKAKSFSVRETGVEQWKGGGWPVRVFSEEGAVVISHFERGRGGHHCAEKKRTNTTRRPHHVVSQL